MAQRGIVRVFRRVTAGWVLLGAAASVACSGSVADRTEAVPAPAAEPPVLTLDVLHVDTVAGDDENPGDEANPLRTLKRALELARAGATVRLRNGTFGAAGGDDFETEVPAGVTIEGVDGGVTVLDGTALPHGLRFAGDATVAHVVFRNFTRAVEANDGMVSLSHVVFSANETALVAEGATVIDGDDVSVTGGDVTALVREMATLNLANSSVSNMGRAECGAPANITAEDTARVRLADVTMSYVRTAAVSLWDASAAAILRGHVEHSGGSGCGAGIVLSADGTAGLELEGTTVETPTDPGGYLVMMRSATHLRVHGSVLSGATTGTAVDVLSGGARLESTKFEDNRVGLRLEGPSRSEVTGCSFAGNTFSDVEVAGPDVKLRGVRFESAAISSMRVSSGAGVDLGTNTDRGFNSFGDSCRVAITVADQPSRMTLNAVGNEWPKSAAGSRTMGPACLDGQAFCLGENVELAF